MSFCAKHRILTILAIAALACVAASANTIEYIATPFSGPTDFTTTLLLEQWNPALFPGEVLTGATVSYTVTIDPSEVTLTNTAGTAQDFIFQATSAAVLSGLPDALSLTPIGMPAFSTGSITLGPVGSGNCPFGTPSSDCSIVQYQPDPGNGTGASVNSPGDLAAYQGLGNLTLNVETFSGSSFVGGGNNINAGISESATISANVTYTYEDNNTPEPTTVATLGAALIGLALLGRKRLAR
jgi:hypothetical protein